jgi:hypothetical protein
MAKRSPSSLIGGIAVGIGVFVLWLLLAQPLTSETVLLGMAMAAAVGTWIRLANF